MEKLKQKEGGRGRGGQTRIQCVGINIERERDQEISK